MAVCKEELALRVEYVISCGSGGSICGICVKLLDWGLPTRRLEMSMMMFPEDFVEIRQCSCTNGLAAQLMGSLGQQRRASNGRCRK